MIGAVYFVGNLFCEDRIKIGFTTGLRKRWGALQNGFCYDLRLYGILIGDRKTESQIHRRWAKSRLRGEWFKYSEEMGKWADQYLTFSKFNRLVFRDGAGINGIGLYEECISRASRFSSVLEARKGVEDFICGSEYESYIKSRYPESFLKG